MYLIEGSGLVRGDTPTPSITPLRRGWEERGCREPLTLTPSWDQGKAPAKFSAVAGPHPEPCYCICWVGEFVGWESCRNETQVELDPGSLPLRVGAGKKAGLGQGWEVRVEERSWECPGQRWCVRASLSPC